MEYDPKTAKVIVEWLRANSKYPANTRLIEELAKRIESGEPFEVRPDA